MKKGFQVVLVTALLLSACGAPAGNADKQETKQPISVETAAEAAKEKETEKDSASEAITQTQTESAAETDKEETAVPESETDTEAAETSAAISPEEALLLPAETLIEPEDDTDAYFVIQTVEEGDAVYNRIYGNSFPTDGGITTDEIRYLRVLHYDYNGQIRTGEIIVNAVAAEDTLAVFRELFDAAYQIRQMVLVDTYYDAGWPEFAHLERGNQADSVSIAHDNTSAFNYRVASNDFSKLSNHAMGRAIDLNPLENPYVYVDGSVDGPSECLNYVDRSKATADNHMIQEGDFVVTTFKNHGFSWGGDWEGDKDYQHFDYER